MFQGTPFFRGNEFEPELLLLAGDLISSGFSVTVLAGCPSLFRSESGYEHEIHRRGWILSGDQTQYCDASMMSLEANGVRVELIPGAAIEGASQDPSALDATFRDCIARTMPSVVIFTGRYPQRSLVDACRAGGIISIFFFQGMTDSPPESQPPFDAVVARSEASASYYHEVYGYKPSIVSLSIDLALLPAELREPRYLLFVDPTPSNGVYAFARIADEISKVRPDIPILVVEAVGSEVDLANCGLDLTSGNNLSLMSPTRDSSKYWRLARTCLFPALDASDPSVALQRSIANGIPTICSDRGATAEIGSDRVSVLPLPDDVTPKTRRLPDAGQVTHWVEETIRLWELAGASSGDPAPRGIDDRRPLPVPLSHFLKNILPTAVNSPQLPVMPPRRSKAIALVPYMSTIEESCQAGLRALEFEGVCVVRRGGQSAIDIARNDLCSQALHDKFESILFIDSDIGFNVRDALRLLARPEPVISGVYAKKASRNLASVFHEDVAEAVFGPDGGLYPLRHAATGFLRIRSQVLKQMIVELELPLCNTRWDRGFWPFFMPLVVPDVGHLHYLGEDWAFSHRLHQIGVCPLADTTIRLWHVGQYHFGWEEAGQDRPRAVNFTIKFKE